jgi:iron-sulfur cluster assembly protein
MINLTKAAANEIKRLQASDREPDSPLRLAVKTGGCAGLYYILEFDPQPTQSDRHYESQGISIIVDEQSNRYLNGLKLDYSEDLMGGGFRFKNPQALASCDCGHSFSVRTEEF